MMEGAHDLRDGDQAAGENGRCSEAVPASGGKYCDYLDLIVDGAAKCLPVQVIYRNYLGPRSCLWVVQPSACQWR